MNVPTNSGKRGYCLQQNASTFLYLGHLYLPDFSKLANNKAPGLCSTGALEGLQVSDYRSILSPGKGISSPSTKISLNQSLLGVLVIIKSPHHTVLLRSHLPQEGSIST